MFFVVFKQMVIFLIMILGGIYVRKKGMITPENQGQYSSLVINFALPCMILASAMSGGEKIGLSEVANVLFVYFVMLVIVLVIGAVLPKVMRYPVREQGAVNLMFWCTNISFIGLPLLKAMYGDNAVIYVTLYIMATNFLFYSYAISSISKGSGEAYKFHPKSLLNSGMISCVVACIIYFGNIQVPSFIASAVGMIGNITAPLAMMMIGFGLLDVNFKEMITDIKMLIFIFLKMLVFPVLIMMILKQLTENTYLLATCMAVLACPTGGMVAMLATLHNKDAYLMVTKQISLATLISVVSVPIVASLVGL